MINFLVLVWLLKRILYQPVLRAVHERQRRIDEGFAEAERAKRDAELLKAEYESRLSAWQEERNRLKLEVDSELKFERNRQIEKMNKQLEDEKLKAEVLNEKILQQKAQENELKALSLGGKFAARLLTRLASPQLEQKLCTLLLDDLERADSKFFQTLRPAIKNLHDRIKITTAMPFSEEQQLQFSNRFNGLIDSKREYEFSQDEHLIAGISVDLGTLVLHANLSNELSFFTENNNGSNIQHIATR